MSDYDNAIFRLATAQEAEPEDYTGEDGLLYCGSCRQPKEAYFPEGKTFFGRDRHPKECDCQRKRRETLEAADREQKHREEVERLKRKGFTDPAMWEWTFENDNGKCPQMCYAREYVECWELVKAENHGLILWGSVGTGKSYFAGCIANALMEREVSVCMTNFAAILNDLAASFKDRNEYISRLCSFPLLILDDFGMERGTEYGLEQVYNVIDSRYRSGKPLIVTTNLTLEELQNPEDTATPAFMTALLKCVPLSALPEKISEKPKHRQKWNALKCCWTERRAYDRHPQQKHRHYCPPPGLRDRGTPGKHRPCGFRLLQTGHYRHRRRQDDESAGSRKRSRRKNHPCHVSDKPC